MPLEHQVDHARRRVVAKARGTLSDDEIFGYQRDVWSRPELRDYDELVDMSEVEHVAIPGSHRVSDLASLSAGMDSPAGNSRFAIVAPKDLEFGLGRMYQAYRELDERSRKQVSVFRSMEEALAWLDRST
jgi:hypothetical protein